MAELSEDWRAVPWSAAMFLLSLACVASTPVPVEAPPIPEGPAFHPAAALRAEALIDQAVRDFATGERVYYEGEVTLTALHGEVLTWTVAGAWQEHGEDAVLMALDAEGNGVSLHSPSVGTPSLLVHNTHDLSSPTQGVNLPGVGFDDPIQLTRDFVVIDRGEFLPDADPVGEVKVFLAVVPAAEVDAAALMRLSPALDSADFSLHRLRADGQVQTQQDGSLRVVEWTFPVTLAFADTSPDCQTLFRYWQGFDATAAVLIPAGSPGDAVVEVLSTGPIREEGSCSW